MNNKSIWLIVLAASTMAALSCSSDRITGLTADRTELARPVPVDVPANTKLVACPTNQTTSTTAQVGPLGGLVSVDGASISIPAGALLNTVAVTVSVPASNHVEIDISVAGFESFVFEQPVIVTIGYGRCQRNDLDDKPLTAWHFDPVTGTLLEPMPSVDDKLARTVTFTTGHLSGYILAN